MKERWRRKIKVSRGKRREVRKVEKKHWIQTDVTDQEYLELSKIAKKESRSVAGLMRDIMRDVISAEVGKGIERQAGSDCEPGSGKEGND